MEVETAMHLKAVLLLATLILSHPATENGATHPFEIVVMNQTSYTFSQVSAMPSEATSFAEEPLASSRWRITESGSKGVRPGRITTLTIPVDSCDLDLEAMTFDGKKFSTHLDICHQAPVWIVREQHQPT